MNESPTFVAEFTGGEETRMTVFTSLKKLDVVRGVRLARHAFRSRMRQEPPPILKAHFASGGRILETYSAVDLEDIDNDSIGDDRTVERIQEQDEHQHQEAMSKAYLDEVPWKKNESDDEAVERIREQRKHRAHEAATYLDEVPWEERK
jgi:hypothetical protein